MIRAVEDKIIVVEMKRNQTKSGILIPSTATDPQSYGKVLSIGPGVATWEDKSKNINVGDVIVYHRMGGQAISMSNKILCCVPYPEVYGVLEDKELLEDLEEIETKAVQPPPEVEKPSLIQQV